MSEWAMGSGPAHGRAFVLPSSGLRAGWKGVALVLAPARTTPQQQGGRPEARQAKRLRGEGVHATRGGADSHGQQRPERCASEDCLDLPDCAATWGHGLRSQSMVV